MVPVLGIILAGTLLAMLLWRRHLGSLMQVASLVAALLLMIWLQDNGYLNAKGKPPADADRQAPMSSPR
ncbi:hypothetical protein HCU64_01305 [Methylobacterium sp. C25]|uniref:hypothetical protein n=1 Tax=Methylobacterium sp. C25 TaxID=2721622 RepID=UPI001F1B3B2D|nr:hypothetical protein [Methylobacterium sp. C25]MCE4222375.1 hypothetical protein [Methylobacterium sp. C25]